MDRYTVRASVTVDVEMSIAAANADDARKIFDEHIAMTASLVDVEPSVYDVSEDSISDMARLRVSKED